MWFKLFRFINSLILLTIVVRLPTQVIEERCLRAEELAAMEAGDMLFIRVRANVLDKAVLVFQLLVAEVPVALRLWSLVIG